MTESIAGIFKTARRAKRMTLRELSGVTGRTTSFLSEVENGIRPIPKDQDLLRTLASVLGLCGDDVIARAEREHLAPKRLRDIFFKDPELAACLLRVATEYEDDAALREYFKNLFMSKGEEMHASSPNCSSDE